MNTRPLDLLTFQFGKWTQIRTMGDFIGCLLVPTEFYVELI